MVYLKELTVYGNAINQFVKSETPYLFERCFLPLDLIRLIKKA